MFILLCKALLQYILAAGTSSRFFLGNRSLLESVEWYEESQNNYILIEKRKNDDDDIIPVRLTAIGHIAPETALMGPGGWKSFAPAGAVGQYAPRPFEKERGTLQLGRPNVGALLAMWSSQMKNIIRLESVGPWKNVKPGISSLRGHSKNALGLRHMFFKVGFIFVCMFT